MRHGYFIRYFKFAKQITEETIQLEHISPWAFTLCMLDLSCRLLIFFFKINFFEKFFQENHQGVKQFGSKLSADDISRQRVKKLSSILHEIQQTTQGYPTPCKQGLVFTRVVFWCTDDPR